MQRPLTDKRCFSAKHLLWLLLPLLSSCLQPFNPPEVSGGAGFLVVDGYLDTGGDTTTIRLTRSQNLTDSERPPAETRAQVTIEGDGGSAYPLRETQAGNYLLTGVSLTGNGQYRLRIRTSGGQEYLSDYVPLKVTPPIDSVNWQISGEGVQLYVNTHDPAGNTRYYRWEFAETWEFDTPFIVDYLYQRGAKTPLTENITKCWTSTSSRNIVLGTSALLSEDIIYQYPLQLLPPTSVKHQIRYSILVRQFALTREGYDYWQNLKRNTENLGTLFDPQPSQVSSNIRSVNNPEEPVLGFFSAYSVQEKRIFIGRNELPLDWRSITGYEGCRLDTVLNIPENREFLSTASFPVVSEVLGPGGGVDAYVYSDAFCVDCRLKGVNRQPSFW